MGSARFDEAIARLGDALRFGINPSLDGIEALTDALGRPQDALKCIQVTGTNGKTSVARVAAAALRANRFPAGLYTSPNLISYTERMEIGGVRVSEDDFARALEATFAAADAIGGSFTEFELLTAAALWLFRDQGLEWAVLEVGMGGRWDATSVVTPEASVITGVALDHTDRLGSTREEIAYDKAHIIKRGSRVVLGPGCEGVEDIFLERAREMGSLTVRVAERSRRPDAEFTYDIIARPRHLGDPLTLAMEGMRPMGTFTLDAPAYQAPNVAVGVAAVGAATFAVCDIPALRAELRTLTFPGRFETLSTDPALVIDGAHNPEAASTLAGAIVEVFGANLPVVLLAILADKDARGIVAALAPVARGFVVTRNDSERCLSPEELASIVADVTGTPPQKAGDLPEALALALRSGAPVVATGSLFTAGGVRKLRLG